MSKISCKGTFKLCACCLTVSSRIMSTPSETGMFHCHRLNYCPIFTRNIISYILPQGTGMFHDHLQHDFPWISSSWLLPATWLFSCYQQLDCSITTNKAIVQQLEFSIDHSKMDCSIPIRSMDDPLIIHIIVCSFTTSKQPDNFSFTVRIMSVS